MDGADLVRPERWPHQVVRRPLLAVLLLLISLLAMLLPLLPLPLPLLLLLLLLLLPLLLQVRRARRVAVAPIRTTRGPPQQAGGGLGALVVARVHPLECAARHRRDVRRRDAVRLALAAVVMVPCVRAWGGASACEYASDADWRGSWGDGLAGAPCVRACVPGANMLHQ